MKYLRTYNESTQIDEIIGLDTYLDLFKDFLKKHNIFFYYNNKVDINNLISELNPLDWIIHPYNTISNFWDFIPGKKIVPYKKGKWFWKDINLKWLKTLKEGYVKTYENYINPDDTFDNNGKFIIIGQTTINQTFEFVWNIRKIKDSGWVGKQGKYIYQSDSLGFTYNQTFESINIHNIQQNNTFQFELSKTRIEPDKFYDEFPHICYKLYNVAKKKLKDFPEMVSFRKMKYEKLINTLYNIEKLQLEIETDKYNI